MFTGLVETLGTVRSINSDGRDKPGRSPTIGRSLIGRSLTIAAPAFAAELAAGESVAVNGACLTVVDHDAETFLVQAGPETLRCTNVGELAPGDRVNLERSLRVGDRLGGHWVQGHVDGLGHIAERIRQGDWELIWFACPAHLAQQMAPKGSVAVDGVSLTLVEVSGDRFSVALIPHTLANTTLGFKPPGAAVNLETDILAKYVWKCLRGGGVTLETLREAGFA
jgi:riboflavin synthase